MKSSSVASLLLLMILFSAARGIRLEKRLFKSVNQGEKIHEDESSAIRRSNDGVGVDIICKDESCSGKSRKLVKVSSSSSGTTISKSKNGGLRKEETSKEHGGEEESLINKSWHTSSSEGSHDSYPDMVDITEMDYSPASREPPIYN